MRTSAIFSPAWPRSTLKTVPGDRAVDVAARARAGARDAVDQRVDARAGDRRPGVQRVHERPRGLRGQLGAPVAAAVEVRGRGSRRRGRPAPRRRSRPARRRPASARPRSSSPAARARVSAPRRSSLLTNSSVGTRSRCRARISTRVCACTPSTADTTSTAPSSTLSTRSTSAMKSGWPGVSIRLIVTSPTDERHHGRLDRDATRALERERVGLRIPVVDRAELVDDAGPVAGAVRSGWSYRRRHGPGFPGSNAHRRSCP